METSELGVAYKSELTATVFITTDNAKSFRKVELGRGAAVYIARAGNLFYIRCQVEDENRQTSNRFYLSSDMGKTWKQTEWRPWGVIDGHIFLRGNTDAIISYDAGKTWQNVSAELQAFLNQTEYVPEIYQNRLLILKDKSLLFFDVKTNKTESIKLHVPKGKVIDDDYYVDESSGELYVELYDDVVGNPRETQMSIWFPLSKDNDIVRPSKNLPDTVILEVGGDYIGGFFRIEGVLQHIWTMDRGKHWYHETLRNYFFDQAEKGVGANQIWMSALVIGKKNVKKGTYLVIGEIQK